MQGPNEEGITGLHEGLHMGVDSLGRQQSTLLDGVLQVSGCLPMAVVSVQR
jgi:hypothetical protein